METTASQQPQHVSALLWSGKGPQRQKKTSGRDRVIADTLKSPNHTKPESTKPTLLETPPKEEPHHLSRNKGVVNHAWSVEAVLDIPWNLSVGIIVCLDYGRLKTQTCPDDFNTQPLQMILHCNFQMTPLSCHYFKVPKMQETEQA